MSEAPPGGKDPYPPASGPSTGFQGQFNSLEHFVSLAKGRGVPISLKVPNLCGWNKPFTEVS